MFILLSSASSPRYREDILRCLAAPVCSLVQFRYDKRYLSEDLQQRIDKKQFILPADAVVCFLESGGDGLATLVPVRQVIIKALIVHGASISLTLEIREVCFTEDPAKFSREIDALSGSLSPRRELSRLEGKFFFALSAHPGTLRSGRELGVWEKTVTTLALRQEFAAEPFFWTVVGLELAAAPWTSDQLLEWPMTPIMDDANLLIFHYAPSTLTQDRGTLTLEVGPSLNIAGPREQHVDSRYDLKKWRLQPHPHGPRSSDTWMRMTQGSTWSLDLLLKVKAHVTASLLKAAVVGILIAAPTIVSVILQKDASHAVTVTVAIVALISGIAAGTAAVFSIEKLG